MSNSLGTLMFGADIDLTNLKQKIQQGNKDILDALKIDYDPTSYQQMVSKLKSALAKETFEIKLSANTQNVVQSIQNSVKGGGIKYFDNLNAEILTAKQNVATLRMLSEKMHNEFLRNGGQNKFNAYTSLKDDLAEAQRKLASLNATRAAHNQTLSDSNKRYRNASQAVKQLNSDSLRLNTTLAGGIHVSTQLGSALSSLFAVHAARQFLDKVIEIGGQLEKQRISIGAILGDTARANHLFEQIKGLAIKSPFGVVELDQYTKQLAAYGFKQNELFDMTKRLADISAGAGQDIGRLTLALGHVRSATYLTGITLRQFSMNNIPMLKMLADYYTELEGKIVSTAEVQQRISKRQVSYEDVIEQIRRLTNEGGMFYNMQEKISESLSAKFKNLKDAMDIMYGELAESSIGDALKSVATTLTSLTRHWQEIGYTMGAAASLFIFSKVKLGLLNTMMTANNATTVRNIMANKQLAAAELQRASITRTLTATEKAAIVTSTQLRVADIKQALATGTLKKEEALLLITMNKIKIAQAMHLVGVENIKKAEIQAAVATNRWAASLKLVGTSLKNAFASIGSGTWISMALIAGTAIWSYYSEWSDKISDRAQEMKDTIISRIQDLEKLKKTIDEEGKPKDSAALKARVDEMKQVIANSNAYTETLDNQLTKAGDINKQYDILAEAIDKVADKNQRLLDVQDEAAKMVRASKSNFTWWDIPMGAVSPNAQARSYEMLFGDDIVDSVDKLNDAYKNLRNTFESLYKFKEPLKEVISEIVASKDITEQLRESLTNAPFEEQIRILAESGYWEKIQDAIERTGKKFGMSEREIAESSERVKKSISGVQERWEVIITQKIPRMFEQFRKDRNWDEEKLREWAGNNVDDVKMMLDGMLDQIGEKSPAIRRELKRLAYDYMRFAGILANGTSLFERILTPISSSLSDYKQYRTEMKKDLDNMKELLKDDKTVDLHDDTVTTPTGGGKGSKKDEELEKARTRFQEIKSFVSEYKKYVETYGREKSINLLEALFPNLKGQGDKIIDNYEEVIRKLINEIVPNYEKASEARKKFFIEGEKEIADTGLDLAKKNMKDYVDAMEEFTSKIEKQWKLYNDVMKKTGGRKDIAELAFRDGMIWDDTAKKMLEEFNRLGNELGVVPIEFRWDMNEKELEQALGKENEVLIKMAKKIQAIIRGNYENFIKDTTNAYSKSLSAQQKLNELLRQRSELQKKLNNENNEENKAGWQTQIDALDRQIADQQWDAFKEANDWGRIFGNLDKVSTATLDMMLEKLRQIAPTINMSVEATKALYDAIDKIQDALTSRNPFAALAESLSKASALRGVLKGLKGSKMDEEIYLSKETAKSIGLGNGTDGWKGTVSQLWDALRESENKFVAAVGGIVQTFKGLQDVLSPVVELFDTLGNSTLSKFFSTGSNALGAAASVAGGMNQLQGLFKEGSGMSKFLGKATPWAAVAGAGLSILSSIFAMHDEALQEEIEASQARQKEMQNLTKNLEKALQRSISSIYGLQAGEDDIAKLREIGGKYDDQTKAIKALSEGSVTFSDLQALRNGISQDTKKLVDEALGSKTYYDTQKALLSAQRDELKKQLAAEEDKKNSDSNAISDYKQQIKELDDEIKHFAEDMAKSLYDIDFKSWANDLAQTLVDAWASGENAAEAYKKKVGEIIKDLGVKMIAERFIAKALEPLMNEFLDQYDKDNGVLTDQGLAIIAKIYDVGEEMAERSYAFMDAIDEEAKKRGASIKDSTSKTSSKVIQGGFTENETGLVVSYLNGIRADVSIQRVDVSAMRLDLNAIAQRQGVIAEAQTVQLRQIAANTKRNADAAEEIHSLLRKATLDKAYGFRIQ